MSRTLFDLGRKKEALARIDEALRDHPVGLKAMSYSGSGEKQRAEALIQRAAEIGKGYGHFHHTAHTIATAYALMHQASPATRWLQAAAEDGFPCYPLFERDPNLDPVRTDPGFAELMAKLKAQWEHYAATL